MGQTGPAFGSRVFERLGFGFVTLVIWSNSRRIGPGFPRRVGVFDLPLECGSSVFGRTPTLRAISAQALLVRFRAFVGSPSRVVGDPQPSRRASERGADPAGLKTPRSKQGTSAFDRAGDRWSGCCNSAQRMFLFNAKMHKQVACQVGLAGSQHICFADH